MVNSALLTEEQIRRFHNEGVLVVPCFYDLEREILPIQKGIHEIIADGKVVGTYNTLFV